MKYKTHIEKERTKKRRKEERRDEPSWLSVSTASNGRLILYKVEREREINILEAEREEVIAVLVVSSKTLASSAGH